MAQTQFSETLQDHAIGEFKLTASFGVGSLPGGTLGSVASLYAAADKALYDAKRLGRDRVERVEPDASLTPSDFQRMRR